MSDSGSALTMILGLLLGAAIAARAEEGAKPPDASVAKPPDSAQQPAKPMSADECEAAGVCPVDQKPADPAQRFTFYGRTYHFCSTGCFDKFVSKPSAYGVAPPSAKGEMKVPLADATPLGDPTHPVAVHRLPKVFRVDGDASKWAPVAALPAPFSKKADGMLKLAWSDDGISGCAQVVDSEVSSNAEQPWTLDCVELWIDPTCARSAEMGDRAFQVAIAPDPARGEGACIVQASTESLRSIATRWQRTASGYLIEFSIPAADLGIVPAEGAMLGCNYAIDDDGKPIEQFFADKNTDDSYQKPSTWGVIQLVK